MTPDSPPIPISQVAIGEDEEALVLEVLRSGRLAQGPMVERFEAACAEMAGTRHAVAVSSGTTALVVAMEALDPEPGSVVLTSPFTFAATLNAVLEAGCVAEFADITDDFTLDPDAVEAAIHDRTRVVAPVHLYGLPADMDRLAPLAQRHGLTVLEDAAQAHGAHVGERRVGSYGLACFSFYATKNVSTGEGGVVTTDDDALATSMRVLRNQGMRNRYEYERPGHNYRMTELQAALGIPGMARLEASIRARRENGAFLTEGLSGIPGLVLPTVPQGRSHVWHQYTVRVTDEAARTRDDLVTALGERGIASGVYYPRTVFDYDCYREHPLVRVGEYPNAERMARQVLSLPVHPGLDDEARSRIVDSTRELLTP